MKKFIIVLFLILILPFYTEVKADSFNGLGNPVGGGNVFGSYCNARFCPWGNGSSFLGIRLSLYYINNGNFSQVKTKSGKVINPVYITTESMGSNFDNIVVDSNLTKYYSNKYSAYQEVSKYVAGLFGTQGDNGCVPIYDLEKKEKYFKKIFKYSIDELDLSFDSSPVNCGNNKAEQGYRIIIEPVIRVSTSTEYGNQKFYYFTVKELTQEALKANVITYGGTYVWNATSFTFKDMAKLFVTKVSDVGITAYSSETCASFGAAPAAGLMYTPEKASMVADKKTGCGYNIIDITDIITPPVCYDKGITKDSVKCVNSNKNNVGNFKETYTLQETDCEKRTEEELKKYTENGKFIAENGVCRIYCKESAKVSLPGSVTDPIKRGSYFAWPTKPDDIKGLYSMKMSLSLVCKIEDGGKGDIINATKEYSCPNGYTEYDSNTCISKSSKASTKCPSGFDNVNGECIKYNCHFDSETNYINGQLSADKKFCTVELNGAHICEDGDLSSDNKCVKNNAEEKRSCPDGWDLGYSSCTKDANKTPQKVCAVGEGNLTTNPTKCYTDLSYKTNESCPDGWGNPKGPTGNRVCEKDSTWSYGTCPDGGTRSGGTCTVNSSYYGGCPGNYKKSGPQTCTMNAPKNYSCSKGSLSTSDVTKCQIPVTKTVESYCEVGDKVWEAGGYTCISDPVDSTTKYNYNCYGIGGKVSGTKCEKDVTITYECEDGWTYRYGAGHECFKDTTFKKKRVSSQKVYASFVCDSNYIEVGNRCHTKTSKELSGYSCPYGYVLSGTKCIKQCNKDVLIKAATTKLDKAYMSAKIIGGTNHKIDSELASVGGYSTYDTKKLEFSRESYFYLKENLNRYLNKETLEVKNIFESGLIDRGQGVISTSLNDKILNGNAAQKYDLIIKDLKLGIENQFGQQENEQYVCNYTITDDSDECICPEGTKNAGDSVTNIVNERCIDKKNESCLTLQSLVCDSDSAIIPGCDDDGGGYTCIKPDGTEKDITKCVSEKMLNTDEYTLEKAMNECKMNDPDCKYKEYCINILTGKKEDITECVKDHSYASCYEQKGCISSFDPCPSGNCCTGVCNWQYRSINELIYGVQTCDNDSKSGSQLCNFEAYCKNEKVASDVIETCLERKLNVSSLEGIDIKTISQVAESCSSLCDGNARTPTVVYRTIDLNNPFPGKTNSFRKPGSNWNSEKVVKEKILEARGATGYELYTKTPLVTITLTPKDINDIRTYNKQTKYDDYKLNCLSNSSSGRCISEFLHTDEKIKLNIKWNTNCSGLNLMSSLDDFNKCYNSKN